jgi:hypothetical protein
MFLTYREAQNDTTADYIRLISDALHIRIPWLCFYSTCCIQGVLTLVTIVARSSKATESP